VRKDKFEAENFYFVGRLKRLAFDQKDSIDHKGSIDQKNGIDQKGGIDSLWNDTAFSLEKDWSSS